MSKMSRLAQEQQDSFADWIMRYADNYLADEAMRRHEIEADEAMRRHEIEQRITALEKSLRDQEFVYEMHGNTTYKRSNVRRDATALTEYLRENGYPKQPEPTQSDDVDF